MSTPQRIQEENDSQYDVLSPGTNGRGVASTPAKLFTHQPTWNRRKEILIGTQAKVNPCQVMARRASKVAQIAGPATGYYFWMVERIGKTDSTRFWITDAADELGVTTRTIKNYNVRLSDLGFIHVKKRKHKGQNTYAEYVLHPINDLIKDQGTKTSHRVKRFSPGPSEKAFTAKRAKKVKHEAEDNFNASLIPQPKVAEQAEAGRAGTSPATASAADAPGGVDLHSDRISSWIKQNEGLITSLGFKSQSISSLVKDVLRFTQGDDSSWDTFCDDLWPVLLEKCRASSWLRSGRNRSCGFGWLFLPSRDQEGETNLKVFLWTKKYSDLEIPSILYKPGARVMIYGQPTPKIVRGFVPGTLNQYRVIAETITDPHEIEEYTVTVSIGLLSDAPEKTEPSSVATDGIPEAPEQPSTPQGRSQSHRWSEDDDALLAAALAEASKE